MRKEKQIEEMANAIFEHCNAGLFYSEAERIAHFVIEQHGYRKQSEVIEEYRKKVYSKMEKYTVFGREYIQRIMREVENEMKGV